MDMLESRMSYVFATAGQLECEDRLLDCGCIPTREQECPVGQSSTH